MNHSAFVLLILLFLSSCDKSAKSVKQIKRDSTNCLNKEIKNIKVKRMASLLVNNGAVYDVISDDSIFKCLMDNYKDLGIGNNYLRDSSAMSPYERIAYFTLFGAVSDTSMIKVLKGYIFKCRNEDLDFTMNNHEPYYYAKRSLGYLIDSVFTDDNCYETETHTFDNLR